MLTVKEGSVFSSEKLCFFQHFGILCFLHPLVLLTQLFHISPRIPFLLRTTAGIVIGHVRSGKPRERRMRWRQFPISFLGIARTGSVPVLVMRVVPAWTTRARQTRVFQEVDLAFGLGMGIAGMAFEQRVIVEAFRTFVVFVRAATKASGGMTRLHWYFFLRPMRRSEKFRCCDNLLDWNPRRQASLVRLGTTSVGSLLLVFSWALTSSVVVVLINAESRLTSTWRGSLGNCCLATMGGKILGRGWEMEFGLPF